MAILLVTKLDQLPLYTTAVWLYLQQKSVRQYLKMRFMYLLVTAFQVTSIWKQI